jgi:hypothetical protein
VRKEAGTVPHTLGGIGVFGQQPDSCRQAGPQRRRFSGDDRRDESFGRDAEWKFSSLLHSAERGDTEYDLIPITEDEANQIVAQIRDATRMTE